MPTTRKPDRRAIIDLWKEDPRDTRPATDLLLFLLLQTFRQKTELVTRHGHRPTLRYTLRNPKHLYAT